MQALSEISYSDITEVYLQELRRGNRVSPQSLATRFPQYAKRILNEFPAMAALESELGNNSACLPAVPNYELMELIGRGSSGEVYKARHDSGKTCAVKLIYFGDEYSMLSRLDREIESLQRLKHPNIVNIEAFGVIENHVYIVTNYVEGVSLAELRGPRPSAHARYWDNELRRDRNLLATWGLEVATALEFVHQNKIIHRDIKPSNLLIDQSGKCWIVDFGLAKLSDTGMTVTRSRQIAGTPRFMAPEQLRGIVDVRCDIYSLGRTLFELANDSNDHGSSEFQARSHWDSAVPVDLVKIIEKACDPSPERRYQTAQEMIAVLNRYLDGKTPCDRRRFGMRMTEQEFKASMRRRVRYSIAGGIVGTMSLLAFIAIPILLPKQAFNPASVVNPTEQNSSLKSLASAIESEDSGFVDVIGEVMKHSVIDQNNDKAVAEDVTSKIDQIVEKVKTEGLKPGELDSLMKNYRHSPLMNANKIRALHHPLFSSGLPTDIKRQGHLTIESLSKAIVNKRIDPEKADGMLASLFNGNVPKLEQIVSMRISDEVLESWLKLVESSFENELKAAGAEGNNSNQELRSIIDAFLHEAQ